MSIRYASEGGSYTYADGTVFNPPVLLSSTNGWVYKPDEMRTKSDIASGRNRSFPRKTGPSDARDYITKTLTDHHTERDWEKPVSCSAKQLRPTWPRGDSLLAAYIDPTFGWVSAEMRIKHDRRNESFSCDYILTGPTLLGWLLNRQVDALRSCSEYTKSTYTSIDSHVREFLNDPFGIMQEKFPAFRLDKYLDPPSFKDEDYGRGRQYEDASDVEIFTASSGNGLFYKKGVIEEIFESDIQWDALREFFEALEFVGFTVKPNWGYSSSRGYRDRSLDGITIVVPEQGDTHKHTVRISAANPQVEVTCGYVLDDNRWIDRKQREAKAQLAELEETLGSFEYTIEL